MTSVYDLVHDYGYPTAFLANGTDLGIVDRSWGPTAASTGSASTTAATRSPTYAMLPTDGKVVRTLRRRALRRDRPDTRLRPPRPAGRDRPTLRLSPARSTPRAVTRRLRAWSAGSRGRSHKTPALAGQHPAGGDGRLRRRTARRTPTRPAAVATTASRSSPPGPSVPAGTDLYALNPQLSTPGTARVGYDGAQPVRNGFVANLVTKALGMPRVTGSTLDSDQSFTVFGPSP